LAAFACGQIYAKKLKYELGRLAAISFGLRQALRLWLRIADGLGQHLAKLGLSLWRCAREGFCPCGHKQYVGMPEGELNPVGDRKGEALLLFAVADIGPTVCSLAAEYHRKSSCRRGSNLFLHRWCHHIYAFAHSKRIQLFPVASSVPTLNCSWSISLTPVATNEPTTLVRRRLFAPTLVGV
jgi:hypothetical protein